MTAINALVLPDCVLLATDTCLYDRIGKVVAFGAKVVTLPHLNMAIAMRGSYSALAIAASEIGADFESFDEFVQDGPDYLRDFHDEHFDDFASSGEPEFDMVVVGWKGRSNKPAAYVISSLDHDDGDRGLKGAGAFALARRAILCAPSLDTDTIAALNLKNAVTDRASAAEALMAMMHEQRRREWPLGSGASLTGFIVGGSAVLTTIDAAGASQRVLHRWPDKIDRLIRPEGAHHKETTQ